MHAACITGPDQWVFDQRFVVVACRAIRHRALLGDRQFWKTQFDIAQRQLSLRAIELPGKAPEQITENMKNAQRQMSADHDKQAHDKSLNTFRSEKRSLGKEWVSTCRSRWSR